jgi:hypothetical protein
MDLPRRLEKYGGHHVDFRRLALLQDQVDNLPSFPAADKKKDLRYKWFVRNYGNTCWELDAMDPRDLRELVEEAIQGVIDWEAWNRCAVVQNAESGSLRDFLLSWNDAVGGKQIETGSKKVQQSALWFHDDT